MKNLIIYIYITVLLSCSYDKKYEEKYETGEIKLTGQINSNGHKHGTWNRFDIYGNIVEKYYYEQDTLYLTDTYIESVLSIREEMLGEVKHGVTSIYYSSGELESTSEFIYGKQIGENKDYYKNGQLKLESIYNDDGIPIGLFKQYYPDGTINVKSDNYGNDTLNCYDKDGELQMSILFEDYIPIDTTFLKEGAIEVLTEDMKLLGLPE